VRWVLGVDGQRDRRWDLVGCWTVPIVGASSSRPAVLFWSGVIHELTITVFTHRRYLQVRYNPSLASVVGPLQVVPPMPSLSLCPVPASTQAQAHSASHPETSRQCRHLRSPVGPPVPLQTREHP
jgi:hypothetical protein